MASYPLGEPSWRGGYGGADCDYFAADDDPEWEAADDPEPLVEMGCSSSNANINDLRPSFFDLDILDCNICMEQLSPPIFQCSNGHYVCQSCIAKMNHKCPTCSEPIGKIRNLGLEKLMESLKVSCKFTDMGCEELLEYTKKKMHEQNCPQRPYQCPIAQCSFNGRIKDFSLHFKESHNTQTLKFQYAQWFSALIQTYEPYLLLYAEEGKLFIFHNKKQEDLGNTLHVTMLGLSQCDLQHNYCIVVKDGEKRVQLQTSTSPSSSSSSKAVEDSSIDLLLVPRSIIARKAYFKVDIYICEQGESCLSCMCSSGGTHGVINATNRIGAYKFNLV